MIGTLGTQSQARKISAKRQPSKIQQIIQINDNKINCFNLYNDKLPISKSRKMVKSEREREREVMRCCKGETKTQGRKMSGLKLFHNLIFFCVLVFEKGLGLPYPIHLCVCLSLHILFFLSLFISFPSLSSPVFSLRKFSWLSFYIN